jgi:uncharacterized integral membrane protein
MKTFLKWLLLLPVCVLTLVFAIANRHVVTVVFDPFGDNQGMHLTAPLFIILFLAVMVGVLLGGTAAWLAQGKYRRSAKAARSDLARIRDETERLRSQVAASRLPALANDQSRAA